MLGFVPNCSCSRRVGVLFDGLIAFVLPPVFGFRLLTRAAGAAGGGQCCGHNPFGAGLVAAVA
jgi:hypothetical protein